MTKPIVALCLSLLLLSGGLWAASPSAPPGPPVKPPPPVRLTPRAAGPRSITVELNKGWTAFSLPLGQVQSVEGLQWALIRPTADGPVVVDPNQPERIETGRAYWAYSEVATQARFSGTPNAGEDPAVIVLETGWNFIGCPWEHPLALSATSLLANSASAPIEVAVSSSEPWVHSHALVWYQGRYSALDLASAAATLTPGRAHWVYAYQPCMTNLNLHGARPSIDSVQLLGNQFLVKGQNLGSASQGVLYVAGEPLQASSIKAWTATEIRAQVQGTGSLVLLSDGRPSNRYAMQGAAGSAAGGGTGSFNGRVLNDTGTPVAGARVLVEGVPAALTDEQGNFRFDSLPAGSHRIHAEHPTCRPAYGKVDIIAGSNKHLEFTLSALRGNLYVVAYADDGPRKFFPCRISVYETAAWNHKNSKEFRGRDERKVEMDWTDIPMGQEYDITVTWREPGGFETSVERKRVLDKSSVTETFYNSWSY